MHIVHYENCIYYTLSRDEYETLRKHHVFDILNDRFDLWIDEGESETVSADQLKNAYTEVNLMKGEWMKAVDAAIKHNTCLFMAL